MGLSEEVGVYLEALDAGDMVLNTAYAAEADPENHLLREQIIAAAFKVIQMFPEKNIQWNTMPDLLRVEENEFLANIMEWFSQIHKEGTDRILSLLEKAEELPGEMAQRIDRHISRHLMDNDSRVSYLLQLSRCCAATLPEQSYYWTLEAFRLQPQEAPGPNGPYTLQMQNVSEQHVFDRCPICGGVGKPYYRAFTYRYISYETTCEPVKLWMKCESCSNLYTYHFPKTFLESGQSVRKIMPQAGSNNTRIADANILHIWGEILSSLSSMTSGKSVLEIGIGNGECSAAALELGYQVESVEIVEEKAQTIANLLQMDVWCCDFLCFDTDRRYSMIIMGDVIEHVFSPEAALRKVYELLEEDGVLWLSTPNYESAFSRFAKFTDTMWCVPWHITYFSYKGMKILAEKCGFEIEKYTISCRYKGSMELILKKRRGAEA